MRYFGIFVGDWRAKPPSGEFDGIVGLPDNCGSWEIFHKNRRSSDIGSWANVITEAEYGTYVAFGIQVYEHGAIKILSNTFSYAVYDNRYWKLVDKEMIEIK